jgi:hypothetical protein
VGRDALTRGQSRHRFDVGVGGSGGGVLVSREYESIGEQNAKQIVKYIIIVVGGAGGRLWYTVGALHLQQPHRIVATVVLNISVIVVVVVVVVVIFFVVIKVVVVVVVVVVVGVKVHVCCRRHARHGDFSRHQQGDFLILCVFTVSFEWPYGGNTGGGGATGAYLAFFLFATFFFCLLCCVILRVLAVSFERPYGGNTGGGGATGAYFASFCNICFRVFDFVPLVTLFKHDTPHFHNSLRPTRDCSFLLPYL